MSKLRIFLIVILASWAVSFTILKSVDLYYESQIRKELNTMSTIIVDNLNKLYISQDVYRLEDQIPIFFLNYYMLVKQIKGFNTMDRKQQAYLIKKSFDKLNINTKFKGKNIEYKISNTRLTINVPEAIKNNWSLDTVGVWMYEN
jgi:hypothetical protein